ncbi:MAG TPA: copper amine oxidase N-terminal domain-containing protein [Fimbriimonas sp.]|nr:copper amine oxidase N-terminal domain-containing protein [Fimbriimonas sp.]
MKFILRSSLLGLAACAAMAASAQQIQVVVNGGLVQFEGQGPMMSGDRVLVPLRGVLERLGAHVDWDPSTQTVTARKQHTRVKLSIGQTTASVDGDPVNLDVPAQVVNGSTMVPLRFVGEALGSTVHWDASTNTVDIKGGYSLPPHGEEEAPPPRRRPGRRPPPPPPPVERVVFPAGTVFPVTLNAPLASDRNRRGDRFDAYINRNGTGLPRRTRIEGYVVGVRRAHRDEPGILEVRFDRIALANGDSYRIDGSLLDAKDTRITSRDHRFWAERDSGPNREAFVGLGAAAGLIVGLNNDRPIEDAAIGGLLGLAVGSLNRKRPMDVHLRGGRLMAVRLNRDLRVHVDDLEH